MTTENRQAPRGARQLRARAGALLAAAGVLIVLAAGPARAAIWSDTYVGWRYGTTFAEPFESNDISKNIFNLSNVLGYSVGSNFFNIDILLADNKDPTFAGSSSGSQEIYIVERHTLDFGKLAGHDIKFGPVRGVGVTFGFDVNDKNDAGYNSRKRMLVLGPTLMFDVPGFLNVSLLELWESNAPYNTFSGTGVNRYSYDPHPMLTGAWGIPFGKSGFAFEGYANFIAAKGKDEFGGSTKPEILIDMEVMYDLSGAMGGTKNRFKLGAEYQYWKNKFGNDSNGPAGSGAFAKTPMIRAEVHF